MCLMNPRCKESCLFEDCGKGPCRGPVDARDGDNDGDGGWIVIHLCEAHAGCYCTEQDSFAIVGLANMLGFPWLYSI